MKVVVWEGCRVISETEYEGGGPDIHLDPKHLPDSISVRTRTEDGGEQHRMVSLLPTPEPPKGDYTTEVGGAVFTQDQWEAVQGYIQAKVAEAQTNVAVFVNGAIDNPDTLKDLDKPHPDSQRAGFDFDGKRI